MSEFQTEISQIERLNFLRAEAEIELATDYLEAVGALYRWEQTERSLARLAARIKPAGEITAERA